jgi:hypothetical protein
MKYRILIHGIVNTNQATLSWYMESFNLPWETEDEKFALETYKELLKKHPAGDLTLVSPIPVDITVTA